MPFLALASSQIAGSHLSHPSGESSKMVPIFARELAFTLAAGPQVPGANEVRRFPAATRTRHVPVRPSQLNDGLKCGIRVSEIADGFAEGLRGVALFHHAPNMSPKADCVKYVSTDSFLLSVSVRYRFFPPIRTECPPPSPPSEPSSSSVSPTLLRSGRSADQRRRRDRHCRARPTPSQPRSPSRPSLRLDAARRRQRDSAVGLSCSGSVW